MREREKMSDICRRVSLYSFCAKKSRSGCSAQFPLHARVKRAETLFAIARHATLTKSAALLNREGEGINGDHLRDTIGARDMTVTKEREREKESLLSVTYISVISLTRL